jgi:hypothetical protein
MIHFVNDKIISRFIAKNRAIPIQLDRATIHVRSWWRGVHIWKHGVHSGATFPRGPIIVAQKMADGFASIKIGKIT